MLTMIAVNKQSLTVSYAHISQAIPILAVWVADVPTSIFKIFDKVGGYFTLSDFTCVGAHHLQYLQATHGSRLALTRTSCTGVLMPQRKGQEIT